MRPFNSWLVCFAERRKYKDRSREERDDEHRWHHGISHGVCAMTGQYILYDELTKKVRHARSSKMSPDQLKWHATLIEVVKSTPYDEHAGHNQAVAFQDRPSKPGDGD